MNEEVREYEDILQEIDRQLQGTKKRLASQTITLFQQQATETLKNAQTCDLRGVSA